MEMIELIGNMLEIIVNTDIMADATEHITTPHTRVLSERQNGDHRYAPLDHLS